MLLSVCRCMCVQEMCVLSVCGSMVRCRCCDGGVGVYRVLRYLGIKGIRGVFIRVRATV